MKSIGYLSLCRNEGNPTYGCFIFMTFGALGNAPYVRFHVTTPQSPDSTSLTQRLSPLNFVEEHTHKSDD